MIAIKNTSMPKNCFECPLYDSGYDRDSGYTFNGGCIFDIDIDKDIDLDEEYRPDDCPLVEVADG